MTTAYLGSIYRGVSPAAAAAVVAFLERTDIEAASSASETLVYGPEAAAAAFEALLMAHPGIGTLAGHEGYSPEGWDGRANPFEGLLTTTAYPFGTS